MRKTAIRALALCAALALLTLCACGAKSSYTSMDNGSASSSAQTMAGESYDSVKEYPSADGSGSASAGLSVEAQAEIADERKVILTVGLSMETKEFDASLQAILDKVEASGGYIDSQNVERRSLSDTRGYTSRYASISARIPSDKLGDVTAAMQEICNVASESSQRQDITDSYYDVTAHLNSLKTQEQTLLSLLERAEKLEDVITLQSALSDVRYQIESLEGTVRRMDNQVAYSYLNIDLREVVEYTEAAEAPATFGQRMGDAARSAGRRLLSAGEGILLFLVGYGPVILLWIAVAVAVFLLARVLRRSAKRRRAARAMRASMPPASPTEKEKK